MKKFYFISICLILIIVLTAGIIVIPDSKKGIAENLLCERVDILNNYYKGNLTINETYEQLKNVEYGSILNNDVAGLDAYSQTDIDQIISYKIISLSENQSIFGYIDGQVVIEWVMKSLSNRYKTNIAYYYRCNDVNGKYKITSFTLKS